MNLLARVNWYVVASILFTVAMFVSLPVEGVPDFYAVPLGLAAVVSAVLSLHER